MANLGIGWANQPPPRLCPLPSPVSGQETDKARMHAMPMHVEMYTCPCHIIINTRSSSSVRFPVAAPPTAGQLAQPTTNMET